MLPFFSSGLVQSLDEVVLKRNSTRELLEIKALELFDYPKRSRLKKACKGQLISLSCPSWLLLHIDSSVRNERRELILEVAKEFDAQALVVQLSQVLLSRPEGRDRVEEFQTALEGNGFLPYFFEVGKKGPLPWLPLERCVSDPLWFGAVWGPYWKIHGWHSSRWVRRYSSDQLRELAIKAKKSNPTWVIFSHSQRKEQLGEFREICGTCA